MVLAVPREHVEELLQLAADENVEATVIGTFGTEDRQLVLRYAGQEVGRLSMEFLHDGLPRPWRSAIVVKAPPVDPVDERDLRPDEFRDRLLNALATPNIASKHWIIRQYDHEVQGGSVIKPLVGPLQIGPSDAAVVRPLLDSFRGVAIACGLQPNVLDPYEMALAAVDEAVRNVVAVGADPDHMALLDNFCWPSVDDELAMGTLVRAAEGCHDAALAYGIPFISGKDSLHNQFTNQETGQVLKIPNTLLISAIAVLPDVRRCVTMDLKHDAKATLVLISPADENPTARDLAKLHRAVAAAIEGGYAAACHDVSDGGIAVAAAEMAIASGIGLRLASPILGDQFAFAESSGRYLVQLSNAGSLKLLRNQLGATGFVSELGTTTSSPDLTIEIPGGKSLEISLDDLTKSWRGTLDW
jgi:phosphoribosylformylglycinamidine synthase